LNRVFGVIRAYGALGQHPDIEIEFPNLPEPIKTGVPKQWPPLPKLYTGEQVCWFWQTFRGFKKYSGWVNLRQQDYLSLDAALTAVEVFHGMQIHLTPPALPVQEIALVYELERLYLTLRRYARMGAMCPECGEWKSRSEFWNDRTRTYGLRRLCKTCEGTLEKVRYEARRLGKELKAHYNYTCLACHRQEPEIELTIDHIVPLSRGGTNDTSNLQPLCKSCNSGKGERIIDYRPDKPIESATTRRE
jgi:5-methylcytosine-specific restriction endonuclease McrA